MILIWFIFFFIFSDSRIKEEYNGVHYYLADAKYFSRLNNRELDRMCPKYFQVATLFENDVSVLGDHCQTGKDSSETEYFLESLHILSVLMKF